jgi:ABC-2 type transport system ATP-binding protein
MTSNGVLGKLEDVRKRYGDKIALDGLNLEVRDGEMLALLGPNGAGKSTAISILLGLKRADSGSVSLLGRSPRDIESRRQIGVILQQENLTGDLSPRELLDVVTSYYPDPYTPEQAMEITRTTELANRKYRHLSAGLQRQVQFALAICGRPKLLFLDEPTVGLDLESRETLWNTIRDLLAGGTAIILTTHYLEEAEALADRVMMLADGKTIASGTVDEVCALVPRKSISCLTTVDVAEIKGWKNVIEARVDEEERLNLVVNDAEDVARRLLAADGSLRELEVRRAGLVDAFRAITKGAIQ